MNSDPIRTLLESKIALGEFPSAAWTVADAERELSAGVLGEAVTGPHATDAKIDTIYDLASLTKPLITGLLFAKFLERGLLRPDEPAGRYFPEFSSSDKAAITIEDLLTHRSGFEAWRPFYLEAHGASREERLSSVLTKIASLPLQYQSRSRVLYSDLNFILLGAVLEAVGGGDLEELANEHVVRPLGLKDSGFRPPQGKLARIAASEDGNEYERRMAAELGFETEGHKWRSGVIRGEVHDENCRFLGGISGHAGLFSTAGETLKIARQFVPETTAVLKPSTCENFSKNFTAGLNQARSFAFQLAATPDSSAHGVVPDAAFGHLGFTGTMIWIDPVKTRFYVLLTNRTHGRVPPFADLSGTRREFLALASGIE